MKKLLLIILTLVALNSFGQKWVVYKVDSNLTVSLPANYEIIDTLGQHFIKAQISNALIVIQRVANTMKPVFIKEQLIAVYDGFQDGVVKTSQGKLIDKHIFEKNGLQVIEFSFTANTRDEQQVRHYLGIFLKKTCYVISFWEAEALTKELKADRDKLFSSIKFIPGLNLKQW